MKTLTIEWKHLDRDGRTCERCGDTGRNLTDLVQHLNACCSDGLHVHLAETHLGAEQLEESNAVLLNGRPIEELLPDIQVTSTECGSCSELTGAPSQCRTIETGGARYDAIAFPLLWRAATAAIGCECPLPTVTTPITFRPRN